MGSANLDLVRSILAAWERSDYTTLAEWAHPEIEYVVADGPDTGTWTGLAGVAEAWRDITDNWDDPRVEVQNIRALSRERVLALYLRVGRGKTTGFDIGNLRMTSATIFDVYDGKVTRIVHYVDHRNALADLGLKE